MLNIAVTAIFLQLAAIAHPGPTVIPLVLQQVSLSTADDATEVPYYTTEIPVVTVPQGRKLAEAFLQFEIDAASSRQEARPDSTVTLEIYSFGGPVNGLLNAEALGYSSMKRTVRIGDARRVRIYVTDLVQAIINSPRRERGIIVGSVSGQRIGRFTANAIPNSGGALATLTVYFQRDEASLAPAARSE